MSTTDAIAEIIRAAVAEGVREALNVQAATNRRLLSIEQAAEYLNLSERQIQAMVAAKELPVVAGGRRRMIDIQDLEVWIARNKTT